MAVERSVETRTRDLRRLRTWKATTPGMWAWLTQRLAALALIPLLVIHIAWPYKVASQLLLLLVIVFHGMLGVRVLLIDIGVNVRSEKIVLGIVAVVATLVFLLVGRTLL
jgi:succinate dehydrogenase hydrophobic anchor subunit